MYSKDINRVVSQNVEFKRIVSEGGVPWEKKNLGPGPTKLTGGNEETGFYGEVLVSEFITGAELAKIIGLTAGISQYSNANWLKFSYLGKVEFISKKPLRYAISWDNINSVNAVFGDRIIEIGDNKYKIRLLKGKTEGQQGDHSKDSGVINHNSEWNRLMLPIHSGAPSNWSYGGNVESPTENWGIGYTNADLITGAGTGNGSYSWCQEYGSSNGGRLYRGRYDVSYSGFYTTSARQTYFGWRPVLELVD